ncbi:hypothetical protein HHL22_09695 [Hymenobacter sp. RP-2-7]|uniref:Uncharacterized protein n=1 Tax=Hymenobacter polaris TaxID=2682546 RepID=A0A7Y0FMH7_9BACT|nr:hypothetical protein [Hymenobacter polaris]NML65475.1 hypothetical protein [Hymenobacter polaris]
MATTLGDVFSARTIAWAEALSSLKQRTCLVISTLLVGAPSFWPSAFCLARAALVFPGILNQVLKLRLGQHRYYQVAEGS